MISPVLIERDGHVETWTLDRGEQRNPITDNTMVNAVTAAVERVNADASVRCVILTGAGPAFSAGGNIKDIRARTGMFGGPPVAITEGYRAGVQRLARAVFGCEVPTIAAVNGAAIGAGCDLTLMCDLRVASERAYFAESFVTLGLVSGDGGAWLLPRLVGHARAAEMTLTGEPLPALTALEWGLVSEVVAPEELLGAARRLAARIAVNPPLAVRMAKRLLRQAEHQRFGDALELAAAMQSLAHHTEDHSAAVTDPRGAFAGR